MPLIREDRAEAEVSLWNEVGFARDIVTLHLSRTFYGIGVPHGHGAGVILIPGFLMPDAYLAEMRAWLRRIGYRAYFSGIRWNADCPNLLIQRAVGESLNRVWRQTGRRVHLIGHSLGGVIARALASQRPNDVASVITLASPFRGEVAHRHVLFAADLVRQRILRKQEPGVLPDCYTGHCTCDFLQSLRREMPAEVEQTAIYTRSDGVVDWRYCITGDPRVDFEVSGTHIGLVFNAAVYMLVARRLADSCPAAAEATPGVVA
ncbi:MAG TPA: alpha/beta fold hydrolase [Terriglobales bacterium]|nr:alpha/beta fold hydrolase [Terriglobales bacterium]